MKKVYFTLLLLLLCTASVFSSQLYPAQPVTTKETIGIPVKKDSSYIISGIISLPPF